MATHGVDDDADRIPPEGRLHGERGKESFVRPPSADHAFDLVADESSQDNRRIARHQDEPAREPASRQVFERQQQETQPEAEEKDL